MVTDAEVPEENRPPESDDSWFRVTIEAPRYPFITRQARQHLTNARREVLLGLRSLIDSAIKRTEGAGEDHDGRSRRAGRIEVE